MFREFGGEVSVGGCFVDEMSVVGCFVDEEPHGQHGCGGMRSGDEGPI